MSEITYYNIVKQEEIRQSMNEHKIEIRAILSNAISEEIIKEAANFHVMTYIDFNLLNSASNGVVNSWNIEEYFQDLKNELNKKGYKNQYINLYTLEVNKEEAASDDDDKLWASIKKSSDIIDGFLIFWDVDEQIDDKAISEYVLDMINTTKENIEKHLSQITVDTLSTTKTFIDFASEQERDEFFALINKYNSYKEVRI